MKSKFIRILIIINGIIIPIFVLILLSDFLTSKFKKDEFNSPNFENKNEENLLPEITENIKYSSIQEIPNSENFIVAKYLVMENRKSYGDYDLILPYTVPEKTINILFLDKNYNIIGKLLKEDSSIRRMFVSEGRLKEKKIKSNLKFLAFIIANEDTTGERKINEFDQHYLYVSELDGKNLTKVTERKINQFQWISEGEELLIQFEEKDKKGNEILSYGVYNIRKKEMRKPNTKE
jgi:hypothetical protein|tara:strand:- start:48 stop:752 length:705 start_codon:yes stop_codon:yes gene_type:complete